MEALFGCHNDWGHFWGIEARDARYPEKNGRVLYNILMSILPRYLYGYEWHLEPIL